VPSKAASDFSAILRELAAHDVEFIVAGGVCAVLHGAPVATFDLDIVHARSEANLNRLLAALDTLEASYRGRPTLKPTATHLASPGHQLLMTRFGALDLLGTIGKGRGYDELLLHSAHVTLESGLSVRILNLDMLVRVKEEVAGEKDQAVLPILRRTLEERSRS
jgi:hypothetical protein